MKKAKTLLSMLLIVAFVTGMFTGCGKKYEALGTEVSGSIDIMKWNGTGVYMEDLGHQNLTPADFTTESESTMYAVAKEFNKKYPNIKINIYATTTGTENWNQEMDNFKAEHGKYPDVFSSVDLIGDVKRGMVADLSIFKDDPLYKSFNPTIMNMMNYYGFQAGLPWYIVPWGVYVNKELAEQNNIDVPPIDWNIDEYTAFISSADNKNFWGAMDAATDFVATGTKDMYYSLADYSGTGDHLNINSDEVQSLLEYVPKWSKYAIWPQSDIGNIPTEVMDANGWWSYTFFMNNLLLTDETDPWMMGTAANEEPDFWGTVKSKDWDIYPRPSTPYVDNNIGINLDPIIIHNYAMDDGNPELSDAEKQQLQITYTFTSFFVGSTEALQAIANQTYMANGVETPCLNDSMPLVTGDEFNKQMEIWYSTPNHKRFADKEKMPGFQKILELWEKGQICGFGDKVYPSSVTENGNSVSALDQWWNLYNPDVAGARRTDANWLDQVKAKLPDWNTQMNERFVTADQQLRNGLKEFYGYTDDDFKAEKK
jgi:ABC-type glycerol-3-phosphate transport system substrate-binding protein